MRRYTLALATALTLWIVGDHAILAQNAADLCPARFRRDPVATDRAREAKKAEMRRRGFPERLIRLLDREECVACVEMASDSFHIQVVYNDDDTAPVSSRGGRLKSRGFEWDPQSERWAREQLAAGKIKAFYILNTATRCQCCPDGDRTDASYADWNEELELHMQHVIRFEDPRGLGPLPPDLENPPRGWLDRVPNIERYNKPPRRVVQVLCRVCQPIADRWNSAAGTLDFLWDRKINLQEGISITENAMANRRNEIARLEYQQLFASTASEAGRREIARLKQVNEQQQASVDYDTRRLAEVDRSIAEQQDRMAAILKELLACEEKCKTATTIATNMAATPAPTLENSTPAPDQPPVTTPANTGPTGQAACPDCQAAAAEVARLGGLIQDRRAELQRLRAEHDIDMANLDNLWALRAQAASRPDAAARVAEIDLRIAELKQASQGTRAQIFGIEEEIRQLEDQLEAAKRALDACNRTCAGATGVGDPTGTGLTGGGRARRAVAVKPLSAVARCQECQPLLVQLQQSHRELERLAERANARQLESDFEDFEEQRAKVADYEKQLALCNEKCTTTVTGGTTGAPTTTGTTGPTGTTGTTGGTPTVTDLVPLGPTGQAACPECQAAAAEAARLAGVIRERAAELERARAELDVNLANLANLSELRAPAAGKSDAARVADLDRRVAELKAENRAIRSRMFRLEEEIRELNDQLEAAKRDLDACNRRCAGYTGGDPTGTGLTGGGVPKRTVAVKPLSAVAKCQECQALLVQLQQSHRELERLAQRANDQQLESDFEDFEEQRAKVAQLQRQLEACNQKCTTATTTTTAVNTAAPPPIAADPTPRTTGTTPPTPTTSTDPPTGCTGGGCDETWRSCTETNTCPPIEEDCGVPGTCTAGDPPAGFPVPLNLTDPTAWGDTMRVEIEIRIQTKGTDVFDPADFPQWQEPVSQATPPAESAIVIPPVQQQDVRRWFNPLGLLTRRVADQIERWRGSVGPRPLLNPRDLALVGSYSSGQSLGLPKGVHVLLTDRGGSTGKTLAMQILNLSGKPVRLAARPFAVEPIRQQAQQQIQQAFNRLAKAAPIRLDLAAYCLEFLKAPPSPNQILRLAPPAVQQKFEPMSKVLRSAYRVQKAGLLNPDSNPAAYTDSIKQWAVWAVEQKLSAKSFTDAFIGHTRKNVEAAGQQWPKQAEDTLRKVSPNRWRDITTILRGAGLPVPQ